MNDMDVVTQQLERLNELNNEIRPSKLWKDGKANDGQDFLNMQFAEALRTIESSLCYLQKQMSDEDMS